MPVNRYAIILHSGGICLLTQSESRYPSSGFGAFYIAFFEFVLVVFYVQYSTSNCMLVTLAADMMLWNNQIKSLSVKNSRVVMAIVSVIYFDSYRMW